MRKFATLAVSLALATVGLAEDVKIKYIRPSSVITYFAEFQRQRTNVFAGDVQTLGQNSKIVLGRLEGADGGVVPKGVTLVAYDSKGILEITGPSEAVASVKSYIALFDVEPRKIELQLGMTCPTLNAELNTNTQLVNNKKWSTEDELLRMGIALMPRLNEDGTITLNMELSQSSTSKSTIALRVKPGEVVRIKVGKHPQVVVGDQSNDKELAKSDETKGDSNIDNPEVFITLQMKAVYPEVKLAKN